MYCDKLLFIILFCGIVLSISWTILNSKLDPPTSTPNKFPSDFKFGVATSAYQIEGAWNLSGKGENVFDYAFHANPHLTRDGSNGDVACDSYHKSQNDLAIIKELEVSYYRFSLSWSRILPTGFINNVNKPGIEYYQNLINNLKNSGIEPVVTLYHWDLPQPLQYLGGWTNPLMAEFYVDYARLVFELFGDHVKYWITFNEPKVMCEEFTEFLAHIHKNYPTGTIDYICGHVVLKTHAKIFNIYQEEFKSRQNGKISIALNFEWAQAAGAEDSEAAERCRQFEFGWFAHPLIHGNYPEIMIESIEKRSKKEFFPRSRLPQFSSEEIQAIKGTIDFLAINHYTTWLIEDISEVPIGKSDYRKDMSVKKYQNESWEATGLNHVKITPWGLRQLLNWVKVNYNDPEILITENGYPGTGFDDEKRIRYLHLYLKEVLKAIHQDQVKVSGYIFWSLMDNFQFYSGYEVRFGLYHVDFQDVNRTRTPKKSAEYFKKIVKSRCLDDECD